MSRRSAVVLVVVVVLAAGSAALSLMLRTHDSERLRPVRVTEASERQLLAGRTGFGRAVTGGAKGRVVHVTTDADSGPGSLRVAVEGDAPAWVVFDRDVTIRFHSGMQVGSNKTIDGRGHRVTLTGHGTYGLLINNVSNVIVDDLVLHDFGDVAKTAQNDLPDAIHIGDSRGVWIDHCDLSVAGDKLIDLQDGSTGITVSWNRFHNQEQVFQIGDLAQAAGAARQTVTVDHNFFDHTGYRNPVVSYGKAHVYNNYFAGWRLYGVRSEQLAQVYVENNVFSAGASRRATDVSPAGHGCNDSHTRCDNRLGYLKASGNLLVNGAELKTNPTPGMFVPSKYYPYVAALADQTLVAEIVAHAGATA